MAGFSLVVMLWWGSTLLGRVRVLQVDWSTTAADLQDQTNWLNEKDRVAERLAKVTVKLDPSLTLDAAKAFAEVQRLAQGFPAEVVANRTERTENLAINNLQVTIKSVGMDSMVKFYEALSLKAPYLGIEKFSLAAIRGTPGYGTVVFNIYAIEIVTPAPKD
jgi:hypothetical protein